MTVSIKIVQSISKKALLLLFIRKVDLSHRVFSARDFIYQQLLALYNRRCRQQLAIQSIAICVNNTVTLITGALVLRDKFINLFLSYSVHCSE